jgi:hypothetical protein
MDGWPVRRTVLIGNGLSLAYNRDHYSLANLTERVRMRLAAMPTDGGTLLDDLDEIRTSLRPDFVPRTGESFEDIAGPVDRLANTLSEFGPLDRVATDEQRSVLHNLEMTLRGLYTRVVGAVLEEVAAHPPTEAGWDPVHDVGRRLAQMTLEQGEMDVFCLNYDALLDAALIAATAWLGPYWKAVALSDEFHGLDVGMVPLYRPDGSIGQVEAHRWRVGSYYPRFAHLRFHHLHGAATWMRWGGDIWKASSLGEIRDCGLFTSWAEGVERPGESGAVEPVVLLGDQKESSVARRPFNENYEAFAIAVGLADEIILAGFSFMDRPLTRTIVQHRQQGARVVVINPSKDIEERALEALAMGKADPLTVINAPLPEGIHEIK